MTVPYSFGSATSAIPLSQLDSNFNTPITLGNTAIQLGNTVTTLNNMTLANVTVSSGTITLTDITASGNVTLSGGTANGVAYLNGSKVVTTGSALTFDGTNLKVAGETSITGGSQSTLNALHLYFDTGTNTSFIKSYHSGVDDRDLTIGARNIAFQVPNGTEIGRFTSTGLGIGTSSPSQKLHVVGAIAATGQASALTASSTFSDYIVGNNKARFAVVGDATGTTGQIIFSQYSSNGSVGRDAATLDSSGNLGLGVTPSAWLSSRKVFQIGATGSIGNNSGNTLLGDNYYTDSTPTNKYLTSNYATLYQQTSGTHVWYNAPSGTAGNPISFTQAMTLDASGNLGVGTTSPGFRLDVSAARATSRVTSSTGTNAVDFQVNNTGGQLLLGIDSSTGGSLFGAGGYTAGLWYSGAYPLTFGTNNTERARIDSSGNLLVGTTSGSFHRFFKSSAGDFATQVANTSATAPYGQLITFGSAAPNDATSMFLRCDDTGVTGRIQLRSNGGIANYQANDVNLSDRREKTNFAPAKSYLDTICAIPVQTFNYIDQSEDDPGLTLGVVAQDVQSVAPELVSESNWGTEEEPKMRLSIYQTDLQYALMKCIQEQQAIIDTLTARITALEGK